MITPGNQMPIGKGSATTATTHLYSKIILYGCLSSAAIYLSKKMIRKYIDVKNRAYLNNNTNTPSTSIKVDSSKQSNEYEGQYGVLPERSPSQGNACVFVLKGIDRDPSGMVGGLSSFCCEDVGLDDVSFEDLMSLRNLCLYCIDFKRALFIFLEIQNEYIVSKEEEDSLNKREVSLSADDTTKGPSRRHILLTLPFFDRGVRKLATSHVYVVSFSTIWKYFTVSTNQNNVSTSLASATTKTKTIIATSETTNITDTHREKEASSSSSSLLSSATSSTSSSSSSAASSTTTTTTSGFSLLSDCVEPNAKSPIFPDKGNVIYVWNTGRCGSTLMHRVLIEMGVASLSEPYWLEQISMSRWNQDLDLDFETIKNYFWLCQSIDFKLANNSLYPSSCIYALDPKAFGHWMLPFVIELNPKAKHIFLYRDCISVIESFQSIFFYETPWFQRNYQLFKSYIQNFLFSYKYVTISETLARILQKRYLPLPSKPGVAKGVLRWVDCMLTIKEYKEANRFAPGSLLIYRFNEFVNKDITHRKKLLQQLYSFIHGSSSSSYFDVEKKREEEQTGKGKANEDKDDGKDKPGKPARGGKVEAKSEKSHFAPNSLTENDLERIMSVFGSHSQKGDRMEKSSAHTGRTYLNWSDRMQINLLLRCIPEIKTSDYVLPGSEYIRKD